MLRFWSAITRRLRKRDPRPDYGTGYYVRSTANPIAPETGLSFDEMIEALNSLDDVGEVK